jgi:hypothetical protein
MQPEMVELISDGLHKAGLKIAGMHEKPGGAKTSVSGAVRKRRG